MQPFAKLATAVAAILLSASCIAQVTTISGVRYEPATELRGGAQLHLNGAGTRYRGPFQVYTAGLYLARKANTSEEALATPGAKRLAITMLREVDAGELGKLFIRGVEDNLADRSTFSRLVPGLMRMSQVFSQHRKLNAGETITIDWLPGTGTVISVRGVAQGEPFREPEFHTALMRIWLGPAPADWQLKERLLGRARGGEVHVAFN